MPWAPDYVTAVEAATYLRIDDAVDNVDLALWATSASRAADRWANRQFGQLAAPAARTYRRPPVYDPQSAMWLLAIDDLQDVTGFLVNGVAYASSGAVLLPDNAPPNSRPWTHLGFTYSAAPTPYVLTGRWGWTATPSQTIAACKLQIARWSARRDSPLGVAGSPDTGSELRLLARLDPDVSVLMAGLARPRRPG